ncbi:MAG: hypothetical protein RLY66_426 [Candidatus Parcubacteria bacterium]|jgi:hypothetical protein
MLELTTGVMFLMSSLYGSGQSDNHIDTINANSDTIEVTTTEARSLTSSKQMQSYLQQEYFDTPILIEVARCESEYRQFDSNGKVIRGRVVADDIGVMQINEYFHGETAKKMGLNIYTAEGNVAYAKYLYSKYGLKPWSASAPCWNKNGDIALAK